MTKSRRGIVRAVALLVVSLAGTIVPSSSASAEAFDTPCSVCAPLDWCPEVEVQDAMCASACGDGNFSDQNCAMSGESGKCALAELVSFTCSQH
jgi:hypothetical protein